MLENQPAKIYRHLLKVDVAELGPAAWYRLVKTKLLHSVST